MSLLILPDAILLNLSAISLWCLPSINSGQTSFTKDIKSFLINLLEYSIMLWRSNRNTKGSDTDKVKFKNILWSSEYLSSTEKY